MTNPTISQRVRFPRQWSETQTPNWPVELNKNHFQANGLTAWWPLTRDGNDWSGNGSNISISGLTFATFVSTARGPAVSFGTLNPIYKVHIINPIAKITNPLTVSAWVNPTSLSQQSFGGGLGATILESNEDGQGDGWILGIRDDGLLWFWPSTDNDVFSNGAISLNVWTHVAVTYDGTNARFYINGLLDSTVGMSVPQTPTYYSFGSQSHITGNFIGSMNDVRLYDVALDPMTISSMMTSPSALVRPAVRRQYAMQNTPLTMAEATATGSSSATAVGQGLLKTIGSASGTSSATATSRSLQKGMGSATGASTANAVMQGDKDCIGFATGNSSAHAVMLSLNKAIARGSGNSSATATGTGYVPQYPTPITIYAVWQVINLVYPGQ